jgi:hypothetical protein
MPFARTTAEQGQIPLRAKTDEWRYVRSGSSAAPPEPVLNEDFIRGAGVDL